MSTVIVKFLRSAVPYMAGEIAGFSPDEARRLEKQGIVRVVSPGGQVTADVALQAEVGGGTPAEAASQAEEAGAEPAEARSKPRRK